MVALTAQKKTKRNKNRPKKKDVGGGRAQNSKWLKAKMYVDVSVFFSVTTAMNLTLLFQCYRLHVLVSTSAAAQSPYCAPRNTSVPFFYWSVFY